MPLFPPTDETKLKHEVDQLAERVADANDKWAIREQAEAFLNNARNAFNAADMNWQTAAGEVAAQRAYLAGLVNDIDGDDPTPNDP